MWSEQGHLSYSRDSPLDSSVSSYSSSVIQQMLKINIDRQKQSNSDLKARSTKYNSSYQKLKETRTSDILQTLQKFDKKYVNINRVIEHNDSSLSLDTTSLENLSFTTKNNAASDTDITQKKSTMMNFDDTEKSKNENSHFSDYGQVLTPKQRSHKVKLDNASETSIAEKLSNESIKSKPWLKVTEETKNRNKSQPENNTFLISESRTKAPSDTEFAEKATYSNNKQKHCHEQLDYLSALKIKSDYNESKLDSSSSSTIHTEPSASMRSYANTEKHLGASLQKSQQNELNILPFKVLTLDDLIDGSQPSSKSENSNPPGNIEGINGNIKQKFTVKNTSSNLVSGKKNGHQETDEEIDEILEDSEPYNNTALMDNTSNKLEKTTSSMIAAKNLQLESFNNASDSSKRSVLSESSEQLVSVKQSVSKAAKSEKETSSKTSSAGNSRFQEELVKSLKPQELKLPKTFFSVSSQTESNHYEIVNLRLLPDKALHFPQGTQANINSQSLFPNPQQTSHQQENESSLEWMSTNIMISEVLKQQIKLTKHFIENQQRIHSTYLTTVNQLSANFKPITLEETEQTEIQSQKILKRNFAEVLESREVYKSQSAEKTTLKNKGHAKSMEL